MYRWPRVSFFEKKLITADVYNQIMTFPIKFIDDYFYTSELDVLSLVITKNNVNTPFQVGGKTDKLIFFAIDKERLDLIEFLLKLGADANSLSEDGFGSTIDSDYQNYTIKHLTCLNFACKRSNIESVKLLLAYGANPNYVPEHNIRDNEGYKAQSSEDLLMSLGSRHPIAEACLNENYHYVDVLISAGGDINFDNGVMYSTPFFGMLYSIQTTVHDVITSYERIPMLTSLLVDFIEKGLDVPNLKYPYLAFVCYRNNFTFDTSKTLLEYCINPNIPVYMDNGNFSVFMYRYVANSPQIMENTVTPLDLAFHYGNKDMQILLFSVGVDITKCKWTEKYLMYAMKNGDYDMGAFLLYLSKSGIPETENINIDGIHTYNSIPRGYVSDVDKLRILKFMIEHGAKIDNILSQPRIPRILDEYLSTLFFKN